MPIYTSTLNLWKDDIGLLIPRLVEKTNTIFATDCRSNPSYTNSPFPRQNNDLGLNNPVFDKRCDHVASDWEDFRIVVEAFGHLHHKPSKKETKEWSSQVSAGLSKSCISPHATCLHTSQYLKLDNLLPKTTLVARTVRLSIVAINPIYRWRFLRDVFRRRLKSNCGDFKSECGRKYQDKYILNNMAFEMDDFTIQEDQVKLATEVFKQFDKRGHEKISTNDIGPAFRALNLTIKPDILKEWADLVDDDATGFIDLKGFLIVYGKKLQDDQDEKDLREAFRVLDKNRRGEIDVDDLRWILKGLGDDLTEEEIDEMIRDTDTDGSGFVDFDEFKKLMTSE